MKCPACFTHSIMAVGHHNAAAVRSVGCSGALLRLRFALLQSIKEAWGNRVVHFDLPCIIRVPTIVPEPRSPATITIIDPTQEIHRSHITKEMLDLYVD